MRTWQYIEPMPDGTVAIWTRTDAQILEEYWPFWQRRAVEFCKKHGIKSRYRDSEERNKLTCIEDWVIANWAWEVKPQSPDSTPPGTP